MLTRGIQDRSFERASELRGQRTGLVRMARSPLEFTDPVAGSGGTQKGSTLVGTLQVTVGARLSPVALFIAVAASPVPVFLRRSAQSFGLQSGRCAGWEDERRIRDGARAALGSAVIPQVCSVEGIQKGNRA